MKKILNFLMVMLLVMGLGMASVMTAFQAEAAETAETAGETVSAAETVLTANQDGEAAADASMSASGIYDEADLLSADEEASLLTKLEKYSERYSADIAIVTTDDAGGLSAQAYADAYAEKIGQSMSRDEYPGILFLIDMDNRQAACPHRRQCGYNQHCPAAIADNGCLFYGLPAGTAIPDNFPAMY